MYVSSRYSVTVVLNEDEQYRAEGPTGPFMVRQVRDAYQHYALRGFGIKKDGELSSLQRDAVAKFSDLPPAVREAIVAEYERLGSELSERALSLAAIAT